MSYRAAITADSQLILFLNKGQGNRGIWFPSASF